MSTYMTFEKKNTFLQLLLLIIMCALFSSVYYTNGFFSILLIFEFFITTHVPIAYIYNVYYERSVIALASMS